MKHSAALLVLLLSLSLAGPLAAAQNNGDASALRASYKLEGARHYQQALKQLARMSTTAQASYFFALRRGWLQYLSRQYSDSAASYARAQRLAPRALEPQLGRMLPLMALRRWKDAAVLAKRILRVAPGNYLAASRLAWCDYNLGRFASAAARYQTLVTHYPGDVEMRAGLGWALLKQNQKIRARRQFYAVLAIAPDHKSAQTGLALSK